MKRLLAIALLLPFGLVAGTRQAFPVLGAADCCDTEIVTNVPFVVSSVDNVFSLTMTLAATSNNCAVIAFGRDCDADGVLSRVETDMCLGWDAGSWVFTDYRSEIGWSVPRPDGEKTLSLTIFLNAERCGKKLLACDNDGEVHASGVMLTAFDPEWNLARIVARGASSPAASTMVNFKSFGTIILLR